MSFRKNHFAFVLLMLCTLLFSGCTMQELYTAKSDNNTEAADQLARSFIETLKSGDMAALASISTPTLSTPEAEKMLLETVKEMDKGDIVSIEQIKSRRLTQYFSKTTRILMGYQIEFEKGWMKAVVVVNSVEGNPDLKVSTLYIEPLKSSMSELYAFNILEAPTANFVVLAIAICIPLFIIYTASVCLRMRKALKYRVLWMFFIIVGVGTFSFDWSSGSMGFKLFSALLMGSGAYMDTQYGPWVISFSFPIGAVIFLFYISKTLAKQQAAGGEEKDAASRCELKG